MDRATGPEGGGSSEVGRGEVATGATQGLNSPLERLERLVVAFSASLTEGQVVDVAMREGAFALGARSAAFFGYCDEEELLRVEGVLGFPDDFLAKGQTIPISSPTAVAEAVRTRQPRFFVDGPAYSARFPNRKPLVQPESRAGAVIPLVCEEHVLGVLAIAYGEPRVLSGEEEILARSLGRLAAECFERARVRRAERRAHRRITLLARTWGVLSSSVERSEVAEHFARILVPELADVCAIALQGEQHELGHVSLANADPYKERLMRGALLEGRQLADHAAIQRVIATAEPELVQRIEDDALVAMAEDEAHLELLRKVTPQSQIIVPLKTATAVIGVLSAGAYGRRFAKDDLEGLEDLAWRAAAALENARLYRTEQRARVEAERANRAKDEFLSIVSHELRTPLGAILGWAQLLANKVRDPEMVARGLVVVERNARAQLRIVEDILDVSRIVAGKLQVELTPIEIDVVARAAVDAVRPLAEHATLTLTLEDDGRIPRILGDAERLQQVFSNILSNAVKFTPAGGSIEVHVARRPSSVDVIVRDTGIGIDPAFLPYVFDRFRQADSSSRRRHQGLGLGLAIVRHLVELHGGTVRAESKGTGLGATVTVSLPVPTVHVRPAPRP